MRAHDREEFEAKPESESRREFKLFESASEFEAKLGQD